MDHESRRKFLKNTSLLAGIGFTDFAQDPITIFPIESQNGKLTITSHEKGQVIKPLRVHHRNRLFFRSSQKAHKIVYLKDGFAL